MKNLKRKEGSFKSAYTIVLIAVVFLFSAFAFSSCAKEHTHRFDEDLVIVPTCTEDGLLRLSCIDKACGYIEERVIVAIGHNVVDVPALAPTCTSNGYVEHTKCTECDWTTLDKDGIKNAVPHDLVHVDDRQKKNPEYPIQYPTCTKDGYHHEYEECRTCGTNFDAVKNIDFALGHNICVEEAREATCNKGWEKFEYCKGWSSAELSKKGYPNMPVVAASTPNSNNGCGYNTYVERPAVDDHVMSTEFEYVLVEAATCETAGQYKLVSTCTTCSTDWPKWSNITPTTAEKIGIIDALGHTPDKTNPQTIVTVAATCTAKGYCQYAYSCSVCKAVAELHEEIYDIIPHDYEKVAEKLATCLESGYSEYEYCRECNKIRGKQIYQPTGHNIEYMPEKLPTCTEDGWFSYAVCTSCDYNTKKASIRPALGHDNETVGAKAPTCTEGGWNEYIVCKREGCGETTKDSNVLPALGHGDKIESVEVTKYPTCTTNGAYDIVTRCSVCDAEIARQYNLVSAALGHNYHNNGYCERYSNCGARISIGLSYSKNSDGTYTVVGIGSCTDTEVIIPKEYNGEKVVAIAEKAFSENSKITSVKIGDNVTVIGEKAFYYCKNLKTVTIGASVVKVGSSAFRYCSAITNTYYTGSNWSGIDFTSWNDNLTTKY